MVPMHVQHRQRRMRAYEARDIPRREVNAVAAEVYGLQRSASNQSLAQRFAHRIPKLAEGHVEGPQVVQPPETRAPPIEVAQLVLGEVDGVDLVGQRDQQVLRSFLCEPVRPQERVPHFRRIGLQRLNDRLGSPVCHATVLQLQRPAVGADDAGGGWVDFRQLARIHEPPERLCQTVVAGAIRKSTVAEEELWLLRTCTLCSGRRRPRRCACDTRQLRCPNAAIPRRTVKRSRALWRPICTQTIVEKMRLL
mmetsp:Transcript_113694/g.321497  ORF Transcript_113694/g.321497 Transcript_113694/m.321497 type:complete len:251 (-) Transcript_113694:414-1166(-)